MKESKQERLNKELGDFFQHIHEEYGTGVGVLALDYGNNGDVCLGMMFGKKSQVNERVMKRLQETCESTINGARAEYFSDEVDIDDLPDPHDRKAMAEFVLKHDLLNEDGEIDKKKVDALMEKLKKEYISRMLKKMGD